MSSTDNILWKEEKFVFHEDLFQKFCWHKRLEKGRKLREDGTKCWVESRYLKVEEKKGLYFKWILKLKERKEVEERKGEWRKRKEQSQTTKAIRSKREHNLLGIK